MNRQKIIIYGGSFNPPTIAHAAVVDAARQLDGYDQIWVLPSKDRLDKTTNVNGAIRLKMLNALLKECFCGNDYIKSSDFELKLPGKTMTYSTINKMSKKYPNVDFTWLIGADSWINMPSWANGELLRASVNWLIIPRTGCKINGPLPKNAQLLNVAIFAGPVSSTMIRQRIANNQSAMPYVTPAVNKLIIKNKLYTTSVKPNKVKKRRLLNVAVVAR